MLDKGKGLREPALLKTRSGKNFTGNNSLTGRTLLRQPQGCLGLLLIAICWPLNWTLPGMRTAYLFFPLWLGYVLVVDGLVERRTGSSLWTRSRRDFVLLF